MSNELLIGLATTGVTGLCILLWNTDGSLDYIALIIGAVCTLCGLTITIWDAAIYTAYNALPVLGNDLDRKIEAPIKALRFGFGLQYSFLLAGSALAYLPKLMEVSRKARFKRSD